MTLQDTISQLHEIAGIKFGNFKLKSGIMSPVYFDLRVIISRPKLLNTVSQLLWKAHPDPESADLLCGVPYTALPLATLMSVEHDKPSIIRRKEAKPYGTKKLVEGDYSAGQKVLIVEDVISSGSSVLETASLLKEHGLVVEDVVVFLDRQQGGRENLENNGIKVHSVVNVEQMMTMLLAAGKTTETEKINVMEFVNGTKIKAEVAEERWKWCFEKRRDHCNQVVLKKLFDVMVAKKSNLCVAADVETSQELLSIAEVVGPYICCLKLHADILIDWTKDLATKLRQLADKHNFLLFEDRKLADIGQTVSRQFYGGNLQIGSWCDLITVHGVAGPGVIQGLQKPELKNGPGALVVAEMSSKDNLIDPEYSQKCLHLMVKFKSESSVPTVGLISQSRLCQDPDCVQMTPGVSLVSKSDKLGQTYVSVDEAITAKGADIIIVGRGITAVSKSEMTSVAKDYQEKAWSAYEERCH